MLRKEETYKFLELKGFWKSGQYKNIMSRKINLKTCAIKKKWPLHLLLLRYKNYKDTTIFFKTPLKTREKKLYIIKKGFSPWWHLPA